MLSGIRVFHLESNIQLPPCCQQRPFGLDVIRRHRPPFFVEALHCTDRAFTLGTVLARLSLCRFSCVRVEDGSGCEESRDGEATRLGAGESKTVGATMLSACSFWRVGDGGF